MFRIKRKTRYVIELSIITIMIYTLVGFKINGLVILPFCCYGLCKAVDY